MQKHYDRTVLPKFTCNVRTKFSDRSIFTDISLTGMYAADAVLESRSSLSRPLRIDWDDGLPPVTVNYPNIPHVLFRLVGRVRDLLDVLEPLHFRQHDANISRWETIWSYYFSIVRWKHAIRFCWPDLEDTLDLFENLQRPFLRAFFRRLDGFVSSKRYADAIIDLNVCYEGIANMEDSPMVDIDAKRNLLKSLQHHILHIYREVFPKTPKQHLSRRSDEIDRLGRFWSLFSHTSSWLPDNVRCCQLGHIGEDLLKSQKNNSTPEHATTTVPNHEHSLESHQQVKRFLLPDSYIPAKMAAILGMNKVTVDAMAQLIREDSFDCEPVVRDFELRFSAWTSSLVLRAIFAQYDVEKGTEKAMTAITVLVSNYSSEVWVLLGDFMSRPGAPEMSEGIADYMMTNRDMLEAFVIDSFTDAFDGYLARYETMFRKRSKMVV